MTHTPSNANTLLTPDLFSPPLIEGNPLPEPPQHPVDEEGVDLPAYAERCYLEYAMSVVKGRALPAV